MNDQIISAALYFVEQWNKLTDEQVKILDPLPFEFHFAIGDLHDATLPGSPSLAGDRLNTLS